jgi:hypothetical protein
MNLGSREVDVEIKNMKNSLQLYFNKSTLFNKHYLFQTIIDDDKKTIVIKNVFYVKTYNKYIILSI